MSDIECWVRLEQTEERVKKLELIITLQSSTITVLQDNNETLKNQLSLYEAAPIMGWIDESGWTYSQPNEPTLKLSHPLIMKPTRK